MRALLILLAVTLICGGAFAGTATYVGTHTASDARIGDIGPPAGDMTATYSGATIEFAGGTTGSSVADFPDSAGDALAFGTGNFTIKMVIESADLPDFNTAPVVWGVYANHGDPNDDVENSDTVRDATGYVANDAGSDVIVGTRELFPDVTINPDPGGASPVEFPVTLTINRSGTTLTISAIDAAKAEIALHTGSVEAGDNMYPRMFFSDPEEMAGEFGSSGGLMSVSLIEISGDNIPDVNAPPGPNLTLGVDGATFAEEGGSITLSANDVMMAPFQWKKDGDDIGGETTATLSLSPTDTDDSGVYTLDFDDGEEKGILTSNPVSVSIFPAGSLPLGGLLGLGLLAVTSALAGGTVLVRMRK